MRPSFPSRVTSKNPGQAQVQGARPRRGAGAAFRVTDGGIIARFAAGSPDARMAALHYESRA
ncbi:MAG: hypothetical protein GXP48_07320 [Acidobacteria bacterium]|nr:hypothetical protein [Acidobacteriota bacterium]